MPITNIDNINIRYGKEKHLPNHFDVALQFRNWIWGRTNKTPTFTIWNEGEENNYSYLAQNVNGAWRIHTRQVWITDKVFKNVICKIDDLLVRGQNDDGNRRYFS